MLMANAIKPQLFLDCSDIPIVFADGKRNKTKIVSCSDIPMAYPDGKRNKTNVFCYLNIPIDYFDMIANAIKPLFVVAYIDIPIVYSDG